MRVRQIRTNISQLTASPASAGNNRVDTSPGRPVVRVRADNHALLLERVRPGYDEHDPADAASVVPLVGRGWLGVDEIARVHHLMCLRLSPDKKIIARSYGAKPKRGGKDAPSCRAPAVPTSRPRGTRWAPAHTPGRRRTRSLPTPMGEPSAVNSDARPGDERCVVAG